MADKPRKREWEPYPFTSCSYIPVKRRFLALMLVMNRHQDRLEARKILHVVKRWRFELEDADAR